MTAVDLAQAEEVPCLTCGGAGELGTGEREYETGVWITVDCGACSGGGLVDADLVATCGCCGLTDWVDEFCEHGPEPLCVDCKSGCRECIDDALLEVAERHLHDVPWSLS